MNGFCVMKGCTSCNLKGMRTPGVSFHRVPDRHTNREKYELWKNKLNLKHLRSGSLVCSIHLNNVDIISLFRPVKAHLKKNLHVVESEEFSQPTSLEPVGIANGSNIDEVQKFDNQDFPQDIAYVPSSSTELFCEDSNGNSHHLSMFDGDQTKIFVSQSIQFELGLDTYQYYVVSEPQPNHVVAHHPAMGDVNLQPCLLTRDLILDEMNGEPSSVKFFKDQEVQCKLGGETYKLTARMAAKGRFVCIGGENCTYKLPKPIETRGSEIPDKVAQVIQMRKMKSSKPQHSTEDTAYQNQKQWGSPEGTASDEDKTYICKENSPVLYYYRLPTKPTSPPRSAFSNTVNLANIRQGVTPIIHNRRRPNILRRKNQTQVKRLI